MDMYTALDIAKYIIDKCTRENWAISNLQLQKILYYVQKTFLQSEMEAFSDEIEAWQFGPVVPAVYYMYCGFGASAIRMRYTVDIRSDYIMIINPIVEQKRVLKPWDLVEDTHKSEKAWSKIYDNGFGDHRVIPKALIKERG